MSETVNQGNETTKTETIENQGNQAEKTFTQAEVNAIINKRFPDYKALESKAKKFDEMEEAAKTELQKATEKVTALQNELEGLKKQNEVRGIREEVAKASGIPSNLLTADTKEECEAQAKALLEFAGAQKGYPVVKDGGETNKTVKVSTSQQFADWFNRQ